MLKSLFRFLFARWWKTPQGTVVLPAGDLPPQHGTLGQALRQAGRPAEAIMELRRAWALAPDAPGVLRELVTALIEYDMCDKALAVARQALERDPASHEAMTALGLAHQKLHDPDAALLAYEAALRVRPGDAGLHDARGAIFHELGRVDEALAEYDRALSLRPEFPLAAFHRALARLQIQDFERGWADFEMRLKAADQRSHAPLAPRWDGALLAGRTLLVRREQGLGDEIMFASMLPEVIAAAGHCIIECDPRLRALFARSFPRATVFGAIPDRSLPGPAAARKIDLEIDTGSLPLYLRRSAADFPRHEGYLVADPVRVARWRARLAQLGPGPKVGISWAGGVRKTHRALRSIALPELSPVLGAGGAKFVSLQYTPEAGAEVGALEADHGIRIEHWPEAIADYDETAALVCALDLVVSVCTSLVHLCGALGRPVWVMAPFSPSWRYGFSGESMPWYPSVKLFRQPAYGAWRPVLEAVAAELDARAAPAA
ncbi:MAG: tetratricopeptide repeat protein [Candidatus Parcubacteria bacterium]|nr:tetratricopeptide repeat protein [Burkholderiales bacterium]